MNQAITPQTPSQQTPYPEVVTSICIDDIKPRVNGDSSDDDKDIIEKLKISIKLSGFFTSISVDSNKFLLTGKHRLQALKDLKREGWDGHSSSGAVVLYDAIPCIFVGLDSEADPMTAKLHELAENHVRKQRTKEHDNAFIELLLDNGFHFGSGRNIPNVQSINMMLMSLFGLSRNKASKMVSVYKNRNADKSESSNVSATTCATQDKKPKSVAANDDIQNQTDMFPDSENVPEANNDIEPCTPSNEDQVSVAQTLIDATMAPTPEIESCIDQSTKVAEDTPNSLDTETHPEDPDTEQAKEPVEDKGQLIPTDKCYSHGNEQTIQAVEPFTVNTEEVIDQTESFESSKELTRQKIKGHAVLVITQLDELQKMCKEYNVNPTTQSPTLSFYSVSTLIINIKDFINKIN